MNISKPSRVDARFKGIDRIDILSHAIEGVAEKLTPFAPNRIWCNASIVHGPPEEDLALGLYESKFEELLLMLDSHCSIHPPGTRFLFSSLIVIKELGSALVDLLVKKVSTARR